MHFIFSLNALILLYIGLYIYKRDDSPLARVFLAISAAFAAWDFCVLLLLAQPDFLSPNLIVHVQNFASLIFFNGFYYFSRLYPHERWRGGLDWNLLPFAFISILILFTDSVTSVSVEDGRLVYEDGVGWTLFTLYAVGLMLASSWNLFRSSRAYPEYRDRIKVLLTGIGGFVGITLVFNTILPAFGIQDYIMLGYISICFPPYFIAYAITKQELLDVDFLISRKTAWFFTLLFVGISIAATIYYTRGNEALQSVALVALGLIWAFHARNLQEFLLTTAKRKFVRGWYDPEEVLNQLSQKITAEKSREEIFRTILRSLDEVFELESSLIVIAVRGGDDALSRYELLDGESGATLERIGLETTLAEDMTSLGKPVYLENAPDSLQRLLARFGFLSGKRCMLIALSSPEMFEGLLVLGERSSGYHYSETDRRFFMRLVNYMSGIFYRLTPFEKLEKIYFENKQKLHEAEIQLIRAQKIESIVHATRQCHHEIRTPLNIIRLGIGRIKSLDDLEAYKSVANEEISRALEIVEETLTITDVTKASQDRYSVFDVNEVLRRCGKLVDKTRYRLFMDLEELPPVWGSFSDIQVAITNLIHNAMDAMPDGGQLSLSSGVAGSSVIIEVQDSGTGIPESLRSRVWEPYFSGQESEVGNSTAGRGWGLTIVNRIVTEHMGTINFTSEVNVGTRFTIVLPAHRHQASGEAEGKVVPFSSRNPRKAG